MQKEQTFTETLAIIRSAFKKGDTKKVASEAGCSVTTVRKTFTRNRAVELTDAEQKVLEVCKDYFKDRFNTANRIEGDARRLTETNEAEEKPEEAYKGQEE